MCLCNTSFRVGRSDAMHAEPCTSKRVGVRGLIGLGLWGCGGRIANVALR